jgi:superfamily II DNA or RNA helicase
MKYPNIDDEDFQKKIEKIYHKYKITKNPSFKELCYPKEYKLQKPQLFVSKFINKKTPYKGLLVFHKIGAGKTCAAIRIAEEWDKKVIVVLPASLIGNFYKELRSECTNENYISNKDREKLKDLSSNIYNKIIEKTHNKINKKYNIYSYNKFVDLLKKKEINFKDTLLIIDEIQNVISEHGEFYNIIYKNIIKAPKSLRVVLLSATPIFDKPNEIALTLNLLRPNIELPIGNNFIETFITKQKKHYIIKNINLLKKLTRGLISYYPGAPEYAFPEKKIKIVKCIMSNYQYQSYLAVVSQEKDIYFKDILKLPNNFLIGPRIISNICFPYRLTGERGYNKFNGTNLQKYSCKIYKMLSKIKKSKGTIFIYSNFKKYGGLSTLIKVLEVNGYKNVVNHGTGKNRFALWTGDEKLENKEMIKDIFNKRENENGSLIKIILGSPAMKEGISLLRVRSVHILEPYWNTSRLDQVIGRAVRFCSHKDVNKDERIVKIYLYLACSPKNELTVDQRIYKMALEKDLLINQFYDILKKNAVDYYLFNKIN